MKGNGKINSIDFINKSTISVDYRFIVTAEDAKTITI